MAKTGGDGCVEYGLGCVMLVFVGAVVFVGCKMDDASESMSWDKPATAATQPAEPPGWRLEDGPLSGEADMWIDEHKSMDLSLVERVSADDVNRDTFFVDYLDDEEDLTAADVEMKLLSKPKHGTAKLNKGEGTVTYTPWAGFSGTDKFRYSLKLEGKPEVAEGTYTIKVIEPIPGAESQGQFANCAEVRVAGASPVREGEPGYGPHLDRDGDGIGCEWG
ncbi:excalibur calcium-binding domain-containing protein [Streptomyces sp. NPDC056512]|uniref:excalibur calcium-binding domain-containing protein n=1 Tax=Streptomyces sp. NPDC056512 TaxID=3345846 RepID=UPI0036A714F6